MKNSIYGILALLLSVLVITACNKSGNLSGKNGQLVASKYNVKINEPDSLLLVGAKSTDSTRWSVTPSGYDSLVTKNNVALIIFKKEGSYMIKVVDGLNTASAAITVSDSVYHPTGQYTTVPLTGDQITLVPHYYNNPSADSTYLTLVAQTHNAYCSNSSLRYTDSLINNKYAIGFINVVEPTQCTLGSTPIAAVINFTQKMPGTLPNGTFPLSVTLNGTTYTGSIVATSSTITFNWNYNSGVLISPKQINR